MTPVGRRCMALRAQQEYAPPPVPRGWPRERRRTVLAALGDITERCGEVHGVPCGAPSTSWGIYRRGETAGW
jgi:hypothetical protein